MFCGGKRSNLCSMKCENLNKYHKFEKCLHFKFVISKTYLKVHTRIAIN